MKHRSFHPVLAAGGLVALTAAAYLPALNAGFIWDDDAYVTGNRTLRDADGLRRIWLDLGATPQYYPFTFTTFWLEYQLWGPTPSGYHAVNILLHALGAGLLWRVLYRLSVPGAWVAAAVFAVHPVHVESVAWITERKNVLSGACYLAALLVYLRFAAIGAGSTEQRSAGRLYAGALLLFVLALLSKSVTCSLPAVILLLIGWKRAVVTRRDVAALLPFFVLGVVMGLLTSWMERHHVGAAGDAWSLSWIERCLVAGRALWFYAGKLVWPGELTFIYPRWDIDARDPWAWLFPTAALLVVTAAWLLRRRIGRGPLVGLLIYGGTLLPALGFINVYPMQYSFVADHFQYLASASLIALLIAAATRAWPARQPELGARSTRRPLLRQFATAVPTGLLLVIFVFLSRRQAGVYENLETLWRDTLAKNPACWLAHNNLGVVLREAGRTNEATHHFEQALRLKADYGLAHFNLGTLLADEGRLESAADRIRQGLRFQPDEPQALNYLGRILAAQRRPDEAIQHYLRAIAQQPDYAPALFNLGSLLADRGDNESAARYLQQGLAREPSDAVAQHRLGEVLERLGQCQEAIAAYRAALRVRPGWIVPANSLAWLLATSPHADCRDAEAAMSLVREHALADRTNLAAVLDTVAAVYAQAGVYDQAVEFAERAAKMGRQQDQTQLTQEIEARLRLYRNGQPYRAPTRPAS